MDPFIGIGSGVTPSLCAIAVISLISRVWLVMMLPASVLTAGCCACILAICAICTAILWWGIICCPNARSTVSAVEALWLELLELPQAASAAVARIAAAKRKCSIDVNSHRVRSPVDRLTVGARRAARTVPGEMAPAVGAGQAINV